MKNKKVETIYNELTDVQLNSFIRVILAGTNTDIKLHYTESSALEKHIEKVSSLKGFIPDYQATLRECLEEVHRRWASLLHLRVVNYEVVESSMNSDSILTCYKPNGECVNGCQGLCKDK